MRHHFWTPAFITITLACAACAIAQTTDTPATVPSDQPAQQAQPKTKLTAEQIFERLLPSLVQIAGKSKENSWTGSGFFVTEQGLILTNAHVVGGTDPELTVTTSDGKTRKARKVLFEDHRLDLAIIQMPPGTYKPVVINSDKPKVGATVYALGNPRAFANTLSKGIVSSLRPGTIGESLKFGTSQKDASKSDERFNDIIQHTAAISPGSSGGALIDAYGEVIGINAMVMPNSKSFYFAIPSLEAVAAIAAASKTMEKAAPSTKDSALSGDIPDATPNARRKAPSPASLPKQPEFDLNAIDPASARRIREKAPDYGRIGVEILNVQLSILAQSLKELGDKRTPEQSAQLEYLNLPTTPQVFSATGQQSWHTFDDILKQRGITAGKGTFKQQILNGLLLETDKGFVLLGGYPSIPSEGETITYYARVWENETAKVKIDDQIHLAVAARWQNCTQEVSPEILAELLNNTHQSQLISVSLQYKSSKGTWTTKVTPELIVLNPSRHADK